ncbi:MAG TPA: phosphatidate cytidylyltransferase [Burkholderiales bacterium]|nr:phosphatidate cytidylyltransferase [Burkholderiales bacterium]
MLKQRLITVAVALPLLLALMFFAPNLLWGAALGIPFGVAAVEWGRLCQLSRTGLAGFALAVAFSCAALLWLHVFRAKWAERAEIAHVLYGAALLFWTVVVPGWLYFGWKVRHKLLLLGAGWLVLVPSWLAVTALQSVPVVLLLTLGVVWISDTAAYFIGGRFGRHKLAPQISPGKTVEGLLGAYAVVVAYAAAVSFLFEGEAAAAERVATMIFALLMTTFSVLGDLFESWIKRMAGAKDSGQLLPGHGGVLDRIDSITAAMPFAALYLYRIAT